jgi:L-amino acid N-acyltransferase YncA
VGAETNTIRAATAADAEAIAAIYNEGIAERVATFETRPRSASEVVAWLDDRLPFLVAVGDDGGAVRCGRSSYSSP